MNQLTFEGFLEQRIVFFARARVRQMRRYEAMREDKRGEAVVA